MTHTASLLVELQVEELPPRALKSLGQAFADQLVRGLQAHGVAPENAVVTPYATPRRLAVHVTRVAARGADRRVRQKLMPVAVGLDAHGQARPPLLKKLATLGLDEHAVAGLVHADEGGRAMLFHDHVEPGHALQQALQAALQQALTQLPIPKVMTYQLHRRTALPGWDSVQFVRPAHSLVALHGTDVVAVSALGLQAGRRTRGHRFEAAVDPVELADADSYADALRSQGAVIASFAERRALVASQVQAAAQQAGSGLLPLADAELLDEVTALVERPKAMVCRFDAEFLEVPPECLILTMKANQKYFPLQDAAGKLSNRFVVVSNISPEDAGAVVSGNERVVRARLADARFFFDQDRRRTLASRVPDLARVVYHNRLGTQGERSERVSAIAALIAQKLGGGTLREQAEQAARLAKADLSTGMVGEFPELQGIMGRYYALHDGLPEPVANAIADHYRPRFSGDALPREEVGAVVALADKLETLVGLFGIGSLPTGDKDPFALRRHALGVIRILIEKKELNLRLDDLLDISRSAFDVQIEDPTSALQEFFLERLRHFLSIKYLDERAIEAFAAQPGRGYTTRADFQGFPTSVVNAVLANDPQFLGDIRAKLLAVSQFSSLPEAPALAAANKRITNILKKSDALGDARPVDEALLHEPAELALHRALQTTVPQANCQFDAGDYTASLQTLAALRAPVDAFFDDVMVNAEDAALRRNRLALLQQLHQAMNQVADLSQLA
ncbi:MAG: glycine--tRNA ligase subunit beta [Ottowia sp.]|nr:glycine--tRNA ligase subunit beta [Ottowia sp.]